VPASSVYQAHQLIWLKMNSMATVTFQEFHTQKAVMTREILPNLEVSFHLIPPLMTSWRQTPNLKFHIPNSQQN
jgi:hypothetical protein